MYYIFDHKNDCFCASAETKLELLCTWARITHTGDFHPNFRKDFDFTDLNVSGKDAKQESVLTGYTPYCFECNGKLFSGTFPIREMRPILRRYQVFDEADRSIDIREWKDEISAYSAGVRPAGNHDAAHIPAFRQEPCGAGRKHNSRRISSPAFTRDNLMALEDMADIPDDIRPVVDHTCARNRGMNRYSVWDAAEFKQNGKYGRRCWKNSTKAARQWAKHKSGCSGRAMRSNMKLLSETGASEYSSEDFLNDCSEYECLAV